MHSATSVMQHIPPLVSVVYYYLARQQVALETEVGALDRAVFRFTFQSNTALGLDSTGLINRRNIRGTSNVRCGAVRVDNDSIPLGSLALVETLVYGNANYPNDVKLLTTLRNALRYSGVAYAMPALSYALVEMIGAPVVLRDPSTVTVFEFNQDAIVQLIICLNACKVRVNKAPVVAVLTIVLEPDYLRVLRTILTISNTPLIHHKLAAVEVQLAKVLRMKYWPCMRTAEDIKVWVQRNYDPIVSGSTLYKFMDVAYTLFALQYNQHTKTALNRVIDRDFANMAQTRNLDAAHSSFYGRVMQNRCIKLLQQAFKFKIHDIASRSAQDDESVTSEADGIVFNPIRGHPVLAFECKNPFLQLFFNPVLYKFGKRGVHVAHEAVECFDTLRFVQGVICWFFSGLLVGCATCHKVQQ